MKKIKYPKLVKLFLILINFLVFLIIIKECKLVGFCYTLINLIMPLFFGFTIAWLLKPIMLKFNKKLSLSVSAALTYILFISLILILGYFFVPIIIDEIKNIVPYLINFYNKLPSRIIDSINIAEMGKRAVVLINDYTSNIKNVFLNIFYSVFISFYFLLGHKNVSTFIGRYIPGDLCKDISLNLKSFVRGTLLDTIILFIMCLVSFYFVKMPYALIFSLLISITNVIPFIGPYIGGIPAILVALSVNFNLGLIVSVIVIILQFIESSFIHPVIMSRSLKINPIIIIIGLIVFGHFFGIIGMIISTPICSIIKSLYEYYYKFKKVPKR